MQFFVCVNFFNILRKIYFAISLFFCCSANLRTNLVFIFRFPCYLRNESKGDLREIIIHVA